MHRAVVFLLAFALVALPGIARAEPAPPRIPPNQTAHHLTVSVGRVVRDAPLSLAVGAMCWRQTVSGAGRSLVMTLFRWSQYGHWCAKGGVIVAPSSVTNQPSIPALSIWTYDKLAFSIKGGGVGQSHLYRRNGGQFHACVLWVCSTKIPWIAMTLRANGTSAVDWGW